VPVARPCCAAGARVFSAHFITRSSCVVYDFLFTWKATFKNVIISNAIAAMLAFARKTTGAISAGRQ